MNLPQTLAHVIAQRSKWIHFGAVGILIASALIIVFGVHFDSDVLDMLPQRFDSVQIFKTYDREFSQARELTIALHDETKQCDLDAFTEHFADELRKEPWIVRVLDRSPVESQAGVQEVQSIAVPLLLNLPSKDFDQALTNLEPTAIQNRLAKLRAELEAGSPKAEFQLDFDPLNLVASALKPLAGSFSVEQTRPLASPDGTLRIVQAVTNQTDLGAHACQETMRKMEDFKQRVVQGWDGPKPEILVTGRTPYVGELSEKMHWDVVSTLVSSVLLVSGVFWVGYRRVRPLIGIMLVLMLCCVVAVATGTVVYHQLNMITIGLCSILIGLGVDFGMMLYSIYEAERDAGHDHESAIRAALTAQGRGIIFGALTSAAAFICLVRSETPGFAQLGALIGFGIIFAGAFMMTIFFATFGRNHRSNKKDMLRTGGERFVGFVFANPRRVFCSSAVVLLLLTIGAVTFIGKLRFEANPRSLEPANSHAGHALRMITEKMPVGEPWIVLVHGKDQEDLHRRWNLLQTAWNGMIAEGRLKSAATPAAFAISPGQVKANAAKLAEGTLSAARAALSDAITREGMNAESFKSAYAFIDTLIAISRGDLHALDWRHVLPEQSSWRFVLDRFFGNEPLVTVGYVTPAQKITNFAQKEALRKALYVPDADPHFSGWTYTLADLVPWASSLGWPPGKLWELSFIMIAFNVVLLIFLYRSAFPLVVLMVSLLLSVGAMLASLEIFGVPLNLFNVLAFPLVLGVGVDYGIYVVIAMRTKGDLQRSTAMIFKPVLLSGLTAVAGFGSLALAENPALRGMGMVCAFGIAWCLVATFLFIIPLYAWRGAH